MAPQFTNGIIRNINKVSIFKSEFIHKLYHKGYETERILFSAEDMWLSKLKFLSSGHVLFDINLETLNHLFVY